MKSDVPFNSNGFTITGNLAIPDKHKAGVKPPAIVTLSMDVIRAKTRTTRTILKIPAPEQKESGQQ